jgi:hypothetical protein
MMTSDKSRLFTLVSCLQECARRGEWKAAHQYAICLRDQTAPLGELEMGEYLNRLREALVVAKSSRAHLAAALVRVNAAARFNTDRAPIFMRRQEFGESPEN